MQIWTVQRLRVQLNPSDDPLEVVEWKDTDRKTRTKDFIEKIQAIIDETPQRPIQQIARDLGVSHTTVNAWVKEDLNVGPTGAKQARSWLRRQRTSS